jgi:hypothetical protein
MDDTPQHLYISDNGFVFDYRSGLSYHLNPTGLFIFRKLLAGTPPSEITLALEKKYSITHNMAAIDIQDFLSQLSNLNLIRSEAIISDD